MQDMNNEELIKEILNGNVALKDVLYENVKKLIYQICTNFWRKNKHLCIKTGCNDYDDIIQLGNTAFVKALNKYEPGNTAFSTYLVSSLNNELIKEFYRNGNVRVKYNNDLKKAEIDEEFYCNLAGDNNIKQYEKSEYINDLMSCLTEKEKKVIKDYYIDGYSINEIKENFKRTKPIIYLLKKSALEKMKKKIEKETKDEINICKRL